jgi:hypothetical protein
LGIILGESVDGCVWRLGSVFLRSDLMIHVELRQMRHDMDMSETVRDERKGAMLHDRSRQTRSRDEKGALRQNTLTRQYGE